MYNRIIFEAINDEGSKVLQEFLILKYTEKQSPLFDIVVAWFLSVTN